MPGYDIDRFVNFNETDNSDLLCSICNQIFKDPVVANCCLQTYCRECISEWRKTNNTCPYDRTVLTDSKLANPPRIVYNLLGKLQIRCEHKGCPEVLNLEDLTQHTVNCSDGRRLCKQCYCVYKSPHDCVTELLTINTEESQRIELLEKEIQLLKNREITLTTTIHTVTRERDEMSRKDDLNDFLRRFRSGEISREIDVIYKSMGPSILAFVKKITFEILDKRDSLDDIAQDIVNRMDEKYDWSTWHCFVYFAGAAKYTYANKYISFDIGDLQFEIFNTEDENS